MAKAITQIETVTTVTLTLTEAEADTLQSLLGNHITGYGVAHKNLNAIWKALETETNGKFLGPLFTRQTESLYITDKKENSIKRFQS